MPRFSGAFGSGTGILLTVATVNQYFEIFLKEQFNLATAVQMSFG